MENTKTILASGFEENVLTYLNELKSSGETNMFGGVPYIMNEFAVSKSTAFMLLRIWMDNFNDNGDYQILKFNPKYHDKRLIIK